MNDENLIPFTERSAREHQELSRKGQEASTRSKRKKKMMREVVQTLMQTELNADTVAILKEKLPFLENGMDMQTAMVLGQIKSAIDGNSKAFELLTELNDTDRVSKTNEYEQLSVDELRGLLDGTESTNDPKS